MARINVEFKVNEDAQVVVKQTALDGWSTFEPILLTREQSLLIAVEVLVQRCLPELAKAGSQRMAVNVVNGKIVVGPAEGGG